ncbi:MAG TPA: C4-dicarboxylate ABC transporter substrate-binding protein [Candidatus Rokubacteria bacterium]|nr:C4-dicarboxylate ABC transporter substrate-binding protein [Candidatus Rokubacteria bacterium]
MRTARWALILPVFGLVLVLAGCAETMQAAAPSDKTVIRIGSPFKPGHILVDAAQKFKELAESRSGGRLAVQIDAGTLSEEEISTRNSTGQLEMQSNGHRSLEVFAAPYFFFNAPYVMKDFDHFMRAWDGKLGEAARAMAEQKGNVKFLGIVYRGLRQTTAKKPIYTPADVYGVKLRLPNVATWIAAWKALDATPVPLTLPQLYGGLKTGQADASEGDLPQIASFKLNEVQTHLIITNHLVQTGGMLINKPFFDRLSRADQDLVVQAAREATAWANQKMKAGETALLVDLQRKGMQVVIPDADSFRAKAKPAIEELFKKSWPVTTWAEVLAQ